MAQTERTYNIPLRYKFLKVPRWKRTKRSVNIVREFLQKHMKSENIKLGRNLNETLWARGNKNPPHHIKVNAIKDDEGIVKVELFGQKYEEPVKAEEDKETKEKTAEKKLEKEVKEGEQKIKEELAKMEEKTEKIIEEKAETEVKEEKKTEAPKKEEKKEEVKTEKPKVEPEKKQEKPETKEEPPKKEAEEKSEKPAEEPSKTE
ncbi:50S ribosomal protein L31e [Nanoarchaeota archaeon]